MYSIGDWDYNAQVREDLLIYYFTNGQGKCYYENNYKKKILELVDTAKYKVIPKDPMESILRKAES